MVGGSEAALTPFTIAQMRAMNLIPTQTKISSNDDGNEFSGEMTYSGEGPIGVKAVLSTRVNATDNA